MAASPDRSTNSAVGADDERHLRTCGLLALRDLCVKKGFSSLGQLTKTQLANLVKEFLDETRIGQGCLNPRTLRKFQLGLSQYFRPRFGSDFDMERDPAFAELGGRARKPVGTQGQTADAVVISTEDLTKIGQYFWRVINTPRGLQQKVWFDLMIHLGAEGIENQHSMRRESFVILKSQTDGRRRLQWKVDGKSRGPSVPDDPDSPMCPVKTFQLYLSKLNLSCPALFQRPHDGITKSSRFWFHMFPLNNTMLALMMYDISKDAGLARVYPNFCTQVLPEKGRFYQLARKGYLSLENLCIQPVKNREDGQEDAEEDSIPVKLCAQCLTPVKLTAAQKNKGILCSVPCFEAFVKAKEMRQNVKVSFKDGSRVPQYTLAGDGRQRVGILQPPVVVNGGPPKEEAPQLLGKNIPQDVYKFIQQVAKIQALGQPAKEGVPMLFKEDGSNIDAKDWSLPAELMELTMNVGKQTTGVRPVGSSLLQKNVKRIKMEPIVRPQLSHRPQLVQKVPIQVIQKGQLIQKQVATTGTAAQKPSGEPAKMQLKIEPVAFDAKSGRQIRVQLKVQPVAEEKPAEKTAPPDEGEEETQEAKKSQQPAATEGAKSPVETLGQQGEQKDVLGLAPSKAMQEPAQHTVEHPQTTTIQKDPAATPSQRTPVCDRRNSGGERRVAEQGPTEANRAEQNVTGWRTESSSNLKREEQHQCKVSLPDSKHSGADDDGRHLRANDGQLGAYEVHGQAQPVVGVHGVERSLWTNLPAERRAFQVPGFGATTQQEQTTATSPWHSWQGLTPHQHRFSFQNFQQEPNFQQKEQQALFRAYQAEVENRRGSRQGLVCDSGAPADDPWKTQTENARHSGAEPEGASVQSRQPDVSQQFQDRYRATRYLQEAAGFPEGTFLPYGTQEERYLAAAFPQHQFRSQPYAQSYHRPYPTPYPTTQQYPGPSQLLAPSQYSPYSQYFPGIQQQHHHHLPRSELTTKLEIPNGT